MVGLFFWGCFTIFGVLALVKFKFVAVLLVIEAFNVLVLLFCFLSSSGGSLVGFLVFMVVATMEVRLALVSLTRLWDFDSLHY